MISNIPVEEEFTPLDTPFCAYLPELRAGGFQEVNATYNYLPLLKIGTARNLMRVFCKVILQQNKETWRDEWMSEFSLNITNEAFLVCGAV